MMPENQRIHNRGQHIPIIAFYSVSGGVGKSTLARKFAELVTKAPPARDGRKPNVLLVGLDVESSGLTFRLTHGMLKRGDRTVHEVIAERNITSADAILLTGTVASGGQLYLMPAAPPEAKGLFATIANIPKDELLRLLYDMINALVIKHEISCVVIDCAPGANPYTAAAATLSDVPFLIGRNEQTSYDQIDHLPQRFREFYDQFQRANQKVIINSVSSQLKYEERKERYNVFDYIPYTGDVILETEGLSMGGSLKLLLFEKYIVEIIKKIFVSMNMDHLIPEAQDIVGQEWIEVLHKLERIDEAQRVKQLYQFRHLRWIGVALVVIGLAVIGAYQLFDDLPEVLTNLGILSALAGIFVAISGWYTEGERQRILNTARKIIISGTEEVIRKLELPSHRKELDEMKKLADTIPDETKQPLRNTPQGSRGKRE